MKAHALIKRLLYLTIIGLVFGGILFLNLHKKVYAANVSTPERADYIFFIPTGANYEYVLSKFDSLDLLKNVESFNWAVEKKNYKNHVNPGRYRLKNRMSNNDLINMLRSGSQEPVKLSFNNLRTLADFSKRISEQLEMSEHELFELLNSSEVQEKYGFNKHTIKCMFLPNTYDVFWNISPEQFLKRMYSEYESFWEGRRSKKAESMDMSPEEVITLASIVNEESRKEKERPRIAGLYINRLNKPMRLQADPTVIYAVGDFTIQRVLRKHAKVNSPYNTYRVDGLPPGPICFPEIASIDAVLNYEKHKYLYMCAKADFSGDHAFATNLSEHNKNAAKWQKELNRRRIYK